MTNSKHQYINNSQNIEVNDFNDNGECNIETNVSNETEPHVSNDNVDQNIGDNIEPSVSNETEPYIGNVSYETYVKNDTSHYNVNAKTSVYGRLLRKPAKYDLFICK